ncbi:MAG TPA: geranylgeranyl reductase family protein, partial [Nitrospirales bacterium]
MYDVIVVGMGPAGAVTAAGLGQAGLSVLGLEWKALPRYKVCGGGLSARIDPLLDRSYRDTIEATIHTVRFQFAGTMPFEVTSADPIAYMVMRDRFDVALVRSARASGVKVRENERVMTIAEDSEGVSVTTGGGSYRGRILVGADGANSLVRRSLFPAGRMPFMTGIEAEAQLPPSAAAFDPQSIVLDIGVLKGGYAWVFPKKQNLSVGVAEFQEGGMRAKSGYERFLGEEPSLAGLSRTSSRGHPVPIYRGVRSENERLATGRALLVGDAAHLVDPLFGEGIYYAVLSGRLAVATISKHLRGESPDLSSYADRIARDIYPEFRVAARIAWLLYTFPRVVHRIARRRSEVLRKFYDVLKGLETYQSFYFKAKEEAAGSLVSLFAPW